MNRYLITGSEGFIAKHFRRTLSKDAYVLGVDCMEPRVHREVTPSTCDEFLQMHSGSLLADDFRDFAPDHVVHLAAQVGVADSMEDPGRYIRDNTDDTALFLSALRESGVQPKSLVVASSMSIYGDPQTRSLVREDHSIETESIYGLTKFDQERLTLAYGKMMGIRTVALRFFNVYGPGQALHNPYTGVLAIFANALMQGRAPTIYEDGLQTRDFIHVEDVATAIEAATHEESMQGVYNVCTGDATTILNVARQLARALGSSIEPNITHEMRPGDIRHCVGDPTRIRGVLPWYPRKFSIGVTQYAEDLLACKS